MGPQEDYIETVLTCEGDFYDPEFHSHLHDFSQRLQSLIAKDGQKKLILKKVEPWNSVRVTFNIPKEAAVRLKQLAEQGDRTLRDLGILAVQIEGDRVISLTIAGKNNERTELVFRTSGASASNSLFDMSSSDEMALPASSNVEATRKNIAQYLRQQGGPGSNLFDSLFRSHSDPGTEFKSPNAVGPSCTGDALPYRQNSSGGVPFGSPTRSPSHTQTGAIGAMPPGFSSVGFPSPSNSMNSQTQSLPSPSSGHSMASPVSPRYPTPPPSQPPALPMSPGTRLPQPLLQQQQQQQQQHQQQQQLQQQQQQQQQTWLGQLPMPPHPHGPNANSPLNNMQRLGNKDITSSSPLLVNLLQTEVAAAHAGQFNNLLQHKMPPPPLHDVGPPAPKRKRRPRKPKEGQTRAKSPTASDLVGNIGGVPFQGSNLESRVPPVNMEAELQAMGSINGPLNSQVPPPQYPGHHLSPSHHHLPHVRPPMHRLPSSSPHMMRSPGCDFGSGGLSPGHGTHNSPDKSSNPKHIINPYTGQLEPVDSLENDDSASPFVARSEASEGMNCLDVPAQLQPPPNPLVALQRRLANDSQGQQQQQQQQQQQHSKSSQHIELASTSLMGRIPFSQQGRMSPASSQNQHSPAASQGHASPAGSLGRLSPGRGSPVASHQPGPLPGHVPNRTNSDLLFRPSVSSPFTATNTSACTAAARPSMPVCNSNFSGRSSVLSQMASVHCELGRSSQGSPTPHHADSPFSSSSAHSSHHSSPQQRSHVIPPSILHSFNPPVPAVSNSSHSHTQQPGQRKNQLSHGVSLPSGMSFHGFTRPPTGNRPPGNMSRSRVTDILNTTSQLPNTSGHSTPSLLESVASRLTNVTAGISNTCSVTPSTVTTKDSDSSSSKDETNICNETPSSKSPAGRQQSNSPPATNNLQQSSQAQHKDSNNLSDSQNTPSKSNPVIKQEPNSEHVSTDTKPQSVATNASAELSKQVKQEVTDSCETTKPNEPCVLPPVHDKLSNCVDEKHCERKSDIPRLPSPVGGSTLLASIAIHNDLHGLVRGSNGASTGDASPTSSDNMSSLSQAASSQSPLPNSGVNQVNHDSELSSHSFDENSPAHSGVDQAVVRHNHSGNHHPDQQTIKETARGLEAPKEGEHKNIITVGYALSKDMNIKKGVLGDKLFNSLSRLSYLSKSPLELHMDESDAKTSTLAHDLLHKNAIMKSPIMVKDVDARTQEVQETCVDDDDKCKVNAMAETYLKLTQCLNHQNNVESNKMESEVRVNGDSAVKNQLLVDVKLEGEVMNNHDTQAVVASHEVRISPWRPSAQVVGIVVSSPEKDMLECTPASAPTDEDVSTLPPLQSVAESREHSSQIESRPQSQTTVSSSPTAALTSTQSDANSVQSGAEESTSESATSNSGGEVAVEDQRSVVDDAAIPTPTTSGVTSAPTPAATSHDDAECSPNDETQQTAVAESPNPAKPRIPDSSIRIGVWVDKTKEHEEPDTSSALDTVVKPCENTGKSSEVPLPSVSNTNHCRSNIESMEANMETSLHSNLNHVPSSQETQCSAATTPSSLSPFTSTLLSHEPQNLVRTVSSKSNPPENIPSLLTDASVRTMLDDSSKDELVSCRDKSTGNVENLTSLRRSPLLAPVSSTSGVAMPPGGLFGHNIPWLAVSSAASENRLGCTSSSSSSLTSVVSSFMTSVRWMESQKSKLLHEPAVSKSSVSKSSSDDSVTCTAVSSSGEVRNLPAPALSLAVNVSSTGCTKTQSNICTTSGQLVQSTVSPTSSAISTSTISQCGISASHLSSVSQSATVAVSLPLPAPTSRVISNPPTPLTKSPVCSGNTSPVALVPPPASVGCSTTASSTSPSARVTVSSTAYSVMNSMNHQTSTGHISSHNTSPIAARVTDLYIPSCVSSAQSQSHQSPLPHVVQSFHASVSSSPNLITPTNHLPCVTNAATLSSSFNARTSPPAVSLHSQKPSTNLAMMTTTMTTTTVGISCSSPALLGSGNVQTHPTSHFVQSSHAQSHTCHSLTSPVVSESPSLSQTVMHPPHSEHGYVNATSSSSPASLSCVQPTWSCKLVPAASSSTTSTSLTTATSSLSTTPHSAISEHKFGTSISIKDVTKDIGACDGVDVSSCEMSSKIIVASSHEGRVSNTTAAAATCNTVHSSSHHSSSSIYASSNVTTITSMDSHQSNQKGISILKPLHDYNVELESELELATQMDRHKSPVTKVVSCDTSIIGADELVSKALGSSLDSAMMQLLPRKGARSPFTVAQLLDETNAKKVPHHNRKQHNFTKMSREKISPPSAVYPGSKSPKLSKSGSNKQQSGLADFPRNSSVHLTNFMQKSIQTPAMLNSDPHPITAPEFHLNLTQSVQRVMNAIPCVDALSPPLDPPKVSLSVNSKHSDTAPAVTVSPPSSILPHVSPPARLSVTPKLLPAADDLPCEQMPPSSRADVSPAHVPNVTSASGEATSPSESESTTSVAATAVTSQCSTSSSSCNTDVSHNVSQNTESEEQEGLGESTSTPLLNHPSTVQETLPVLDSCEDSQMVPTKCEEKVDSGIESSSTGTPTNSDTSSVASLHLTESHIDETPVNGTSAKLSSECDLATNVKSECSSLPTDVGETTEKSQSVESSWQSGKSSGPMPDSDKLANSTSDISLKLEEDIKAEETPCVGRITRRSSRGSTESRSGSTESTRSKEECTRRSGSSESTRSRDEATPRRRLRSDASDLSSETTDQGSRCSRSVDRTLSPSPTPRTTRASTRSTRKRASPEHDDVKTEVKPEVKPAEAEVAPVAAVATRGSKRKLVMDDADKDTSEKRVRPEEPKSNQDSAFDEHNYSGPGKRATGKSRDPKAVVDDATSKKLVPGTRRTLEKRGKSPPPVQEDKPAAGVAVRSRVIKTVPPDESKTKTATTTGEKPKPEDGSSSSSKRSTRSSKAKDQSEIQVPPSSQGYATKRRRNSRDCR